MHIPVTGQQGDSRAAQLLEVMHRLRHAWVSVHPALPVRRGDIMLLDYLLEREHQGQPPATVGDLAKRLRQSPPAITQKVNVMQEQGYLVRTVDANDRRMACVELTDHGRKMALHAIQSVWEQLDCALDRLGEGETAELIRLMQCLCDSLETSASCNGTDGGAPDDSP